MYSNLQYANAERTSITGAKGDESFSCPTDTRNRCYAEIVAGGYEIADWQAPPLSSDDYAHAIQSHVDAIAQSKGYADGVALAGYALSTVPAWAAEAQAFVAWRDAVWVYAYTELAKVQGGQRAVPTSEQMIAELPSITWPGG